MTTTQWINFTDFPLSEEGFSRLYRDYINDFQKLQRYYETDFHSLDNIKKYAERMRHRYTHRQELVEVLLDQNRQYHATDATLENIRLLSDDNTFAVVTGQQVGILTGPLYTIYKAITTIQLAKVLNTIHPGYKFVPIFWLEGEDHDLTEAASAGFINAEYSITEIEYMLAGKPTQKNIGAVGEIIFDDNLIVFLNTLHKTLVHTEFKEQLFGMLRNTYHPNTTFNQAFVSLMNKLFYRDGLIFISPNNKRLKQLLSHIFQKELSEFPRVSQLIIEQSAELEEEYHAQIKTKALNLFYFYKGGRYFIEPRENDFSLKGTRHTISKEEMLQTATQNPELLSPNVALRPICQDTILPTIVYVAGPSEIAYFAQLKKVYQYFDLTMPLIYPRASVTLIEEKFERILEKYQLNISDVFRGVEHVRKKVIELVSEVNIDEMFNEAKQCINDQLNEMKFGINYIDSTLISSLENTRQNIEQNLFSLKEKITQGQQRKHEIALRQVEKVVNHIYPKKNFQERELNIIYFLNKHGLNLVQDLMSEVKIDEFKHQIIIL